MWQALGALLPIAVAVAVSSVPITVTILLLLSPNRSKTALPFLIGWVIGVVAVMGVSAVSAQALPSGPPPSSGRSDRSPGAPDRRCVDRARRRSDPPTFSDLGSRHAALAQCGRLVQWPGVLCGWRCPQSPAQRLAPRYHGGPRPPCGAGQQCRVCCRRRHLHADRDHRPSWYQSSPRSWHPRRCSRSSMSARDWISVNGRVLTSAMMFMIGVVIFGAGLTHL